MTNPYPPQPAPKKKRLWWKILLAVFAVLIALSVLGNIVGDDKPEATDTAAETTTTTKTSGPQPVTSSTSRASTPASSAAAAPAASCSTPRIDDRAPGPDIAPYRGLKGKTLVVAVRVHDIREQPGKIGVAVDVCDPDIKTAADLKPTATDIAKKLKATSVSKTIAVVWVEHFQYKDGKILDNAKVKDPDFNLHLWNGKPSPSAEHANWEVLEG